MRNGDPRSSQEMRSLHKRGVMGGGYQMTKQGRGEP